MCDLGWLRVTFKCEKWRKKEDKMKSRSWFWESKAKQVINKKRISQDDVLKRDELKVNGEMQLACWQPLRWAYVLCVLVCVLRCTFYVLIWICSKDLRGKRYQTFFSFLFFMCVLGCEVDVALSKCNLIIITKKIK